MENSLYEEYMRSVLGYNNTYDYEYSRIENNQNNELEQCYPEMYRIVYPMVQKACNENTRTINKELIDEMTNEIYFSVEDDELNEDRSKENRNVRNPILNDLIRILLLRELIGRPQGPRPPMPPPPRPPIRPPMGPGLGGRPPMMPRYDFGLYE